MEEDGNSKCKICNVKNKQINLILKSVLLKVKITQPITVQPFKDRFYNGPFAKMINCIFKSNPFINPQSLQCSHIKLKTAFLKHLNYQQATLDQISDVILMSTIKRNFQLDTVISQIKYAQYSIPQLLNHKDKAVGQVKKKRKINQSIKQDQKQLVKVQSQINQQYTNLQQKKYMVQQL